MFVNRALELIQAVMRIQIYIHSGYVCIIMNGVMAPGLKIIMNQIPIHAPYIDNEFYLLKKVI